MADETGRFHYVYVLRCKDGGFYVGQTGDLRRRFSQHEKGEAKSTRGRRPLKLLFYEAFPSRADALRRERYLKSTAGKRTLRLMLREHLHGRQ